MLMILFAVLAILAGGAAQTSALAQPVLIAEPGRSVADSRGGEGQGHAFRIASAVLKETRHVSVVLPSSFAQTGPARRYPVIVVLDGESTVAPAAAVADELARNGQIPEAVIVAIENSNRLRDLTPPGLSVSGSSLNEGGDRFLDFIERELLPAVDLQFRGAGPRTLIGHSSGGILATYAAATRATFRAIIAIDAPINLSENWLAKRLASRAQQAPTPLRYMSYDARFGWPDDAWDNLVMQAPASWKLHRERLRLEGHETVVMLAMYLGLREAFSDYSRLAAPDAPTTSILPYYASVSAALGATVIPPQRVVRDVVDRLLMESRGAAAREAYTLLAAGYGAPSDSAALLGKIAAAEQRGAPTETVEGLLATPFPTPDEARAYQGDWVGYQWFKPGQPRTNQITLRIRVEAGRVIGEVLNPAAPADFRLRRVEYLSVTANGLTYGFMNGMQPRAVVLFEGTLKGDTLSGKSRFGGVEFHYPPGSDADPGFSFIRVRR